MSTPRLRLAMTVDDLFMWPGLPFPEGSSPQAVSRQLIDAFTNNGVKQVYAFSCTRPVEGTATVHEVLDGGAAPALTWGITRTTIARSTCAPSRIMSATWTAPR
jgi:hypothetical protein